MKVVAYIQRLPDAAVGGQPPEINQEDMQAEIPMTKNNFERRALTSLRVAGVLSERVSPERGQARPQACGHLHRPAHRRSTR